MIVRKSTVDAAVGELRQEMEAGFVTLTKDLAESQETVDLLKKELAELKTNYSRCRRENKRLALRTKDLQRALFSSGITVPRTNYKNKNC